MPTPERKIRTRLVRLWCYDCQSVQRVKDVFVSHVVKLQCGHLRSIARAKLEAK